MKTDVLETKVAVRDGFYAGRRIRAGGTFTAPVSFTGHWFGAEGSAAVEAAKEPDLLDKSVADILAVLPDLSTDQIASLISAETAGKTRKGLLAKMQDEIDNRLGGGENPFA